jgi:hypothetical protein
MVEPQADHDSTCCEPRDKVFNTTEILEGVLECLPAKTLFVVQRVNKRFHETIADSPRIQRKMFLRIDDGYSALLEFQCMKTGRWRLEQARNVEDMEAPIAPMTPVVLNPLLERVRPYDSDHERFLDGGEDVTFSCPHTFSYQEFQHQSIGKGFFSDPQGTRIDVKLCFTFGSANTIRVSRTVESDALLTIEAVFTRVLDTYGGVAILGKGRQSGKVIRRGVPRELMNELEHQTGFGIFFTPSRSQIFQLGFLEPTDEKRVVANSNALEG